MTRTTEKPTHQHGDHPSTPLSLSHQLQHQTLKKENQINLSKKKSHSRHLGFVDDERVRASTSRISSTLNCVDCWQRACTVIEVPLSVPESFNLHQKISTVTVDTLSFIPPREIEEMWVHIQFYAHVIFFPQRLPACRQAGVRRSHIDDHTKCASGRSAKSGPSTARRR